MKKIILSFVMLVFAVHQMAAIEVRIDTERRGGYSNTTLLRLMERNLGALLTEINQAAEDDRDLNTAGLQMTDFAKGMLVNIWSHTHFYVDDLFVDGQGWPTKQGMFVREIPTVRNVDGEFQTVSVEINQKGTITDFCFSIENQSDSMMLRDAENVTHVLEEQMIIKKYMDHFATAYCRKDLQMLRQIFSDDALIITGNVVTSRETHVQSITYKKQNKEEYLNNLARAFARNKYVSVKFSGPDKSTPGYEIRRSRKNPNFYGVQAFQEWRSTNYSDDGYVFLLWDFTDKERPVIHVRTWQPNRIGGQDLPEDEIFTIDDFENSIEEM